MDVDDDLIIMVGGTLEDWGLIVSFIDPDDPRPVTEQFNEKYIGGWHPFKGFTYDAAKATLTYEGDPPYRAISALRFRNEMVVLFPSGWVLVIQPDNTWQVSRMD